MNCRHGHLWSLVESIASPHPDFVNHDWSCDSCTATAKTSTRKGWEPTVPPSFAHMPENTWGGIYHSESGTFIFGEKDD